MISAMLWGLIGILPIQFNSSSGGKYPASKEVGYRVCREEPKPPSLRWLILLMTSVLLGSSHQEKYFSSTTYMFNGTCKTLHPPWNVEIQVRTCLLEHDAYYSLHRWIIVATYNVQFMCRLFTAQLDIVGWDRIVAHIGMYDALVILAGPLLKPWTPPWLS